MATKPLSAATFMIALLASGAALAEESECMVPLSQWQPKSAVSQMAKANGWEIRRIKTDDGCYAIKARDAQGREVEAILDPSTLRVLRTESEDGDDDEDTGYQAPLPGSLTLRAPSTLALPSGTALFDGRPRPKAQVN